MLIIIFIYSVDLLSQFISEHHGHADCTTWTVLLHLIINKLQTTMMSVTQARLNVFVCSMCCSHISFLKKYDRSGRLLCECIWWQIWRYYMYSSETFPLIINHIAHVYVLMCTVRSRQYCVKCQHYVSATFASWTVFMHILTINFNTGNDMFVFTLPWYIVCCNWFIQHESYVDDNYGFNSGNLTCLCSRWLDT